MDDNTFECPNCGTKIYPEMTRCPECGQNMYPEDEEKLSTEAVAGQAGSASTIGAVLVGWMITCGIALLLHFIVASFTSPSRLGGFGIALLFVAGPAGSLVGGYIAAGISNQRPKWMGALVSVLALPVLTLFASHWVTVSSSFLLNPWVIVAGVVTILAGVFGAWLNDKFTRDTDWKEKWRVRGWEDLLYQDLLRKVRFNGSTADRLIEYERKLDPQASRLKLIQNAIERWERDNR